MDSDKKVEHRERPARGLRSSFGKRFLLGLATVLPLTVTLFVFWFLVNKFGGVFAGLLNRVPYLGRLPDFVTAVLGFLVLIFLIYLAGVLASSLLGRWFVRLSDRALTRVPFARNIYTSSKQLVETLFVDKSAFRRVVMVEFPKKDSYAIGFVTADDAWTVKPSGERAFPVFIPTTPNPTSGFVLFVMEREIIRLDLSVEAAMKVIISGGIVGPGSPEERSINAIPR